MTKDTALLLDRSQDDFSLSRRIYSNWDYQLATSNDNVRDYETLNYSFQVIKDAFPTVKVEQVLDSLEPNVSYYTGEATDDYGIKKIDLVYYEQGNEENERILELNAPNTNFHNFYYTFPSRSQFRGGKNLCVLL
ncbi:hypothetical protein NYZ99_19950 [Maribacter litopenaei]|uniref:Uncharacterized protein n=1 Tax=Maribacter litopenaei TaxID=2976127 RepID=A0ABY5Y7T8_9FLAO|nr:hypothetical protein [Maribacter litopenaei]UWX54964.1 hypothetical protein NYZ99_19950 [Maribacter litopenaei]